MNDIIVLTKAIRDLHGLAAEHVRSEEVTETFQGETVWSGHVEVFSVPTSIDADLCYAWTYHDGAEPQYVAVLGKAPITCPVDAVRAFVIAQHKKGCSG